jgi:hypothetical protein
MVAGCASAPFSTNSAPTSTSAPASTSPAAEYGGFAAHELATVCIDATASAFAADVQFEPDLARIEKRRVDPEWLVLVPAHTSGSVGEAQCTVGGTPETPQVEISTASLEPLPEDQIQNLIDGDNEGGTQ